MEYLANAGDRGDVTLDGVVISHVIRCDTTLGYIVRAIYPFQYKNGQIKTEVLMGNVKFERY